MLEGRCGYFDDRNSVEFFIPLPDEGGDGDEKYSGGLPSLFDNLLSGGFRRSGKFVYNAVCPGCKQCVPIRIPVRKFAFSKNQRHLLRRNSDIEMRVVTGAEDMITMEKADLILNGAKDTIKAILPVVDDFERALAHIADDDASKEGVQLIYNKMMKVLEQRGLKPMEAKGQKFDENLHEAVTQFPAADESQKGMVVDVVEKGYYLNDKVLRYAKVVVAI